MTDTINLSVSDRLISMVEQTLATHSINRPFSVSDQLVDIGLTSLDMVNLLFEVEAAFDVTIPTHELTTQNFEPIAVIENLIAFDWMSAPTPDQTRVKPTVINFDFCQFIMARRSSSRGPGHDVARAIDQSLRRPV